MSKKNIFRVVTVFYLGLIFYISSLSQPVKLPSFPGVDKIIHFMEFGTLGFLVYNSVVDNFNERAEFLAISFSMFYGGVDEVHQYFVPGRCCDWVDFLADSLGIILVVLFFSKLQKSESVDKYGKN